MLGDYCSIHDAHEHQTSTLCTTDKFSLLVEPNAKPSKSFFSPEAEKKERDWEEEKKRPGLFYFPIKTVSYSPGLAFAKWIL